MNEKPACCIVAAISIISCVSSPSVAAAVADDVVIGFTVLLLADVPLVSTVVGGLVRAFRSTGRFGRRLTVVLTTPSALNKFHVSVVWMLCPHVIATTPPTHHQWLQTMQMV